MASDQLTHAERHALAFIALAEGEGLTLAFDVAVEVGWAPRAAGMKLASLERRGYVQRHRVRMHQRLYGWEITDLGLGAARWPDAQ